MKIYYSFDTQVKFNDELNKIKTNFDTDDKRHLEWIAEQCIDAEYAATDQNLPHAVKLWNKRGEELGTFQVIVEQRPVLQARLVTNNQLD